MKTQTIKFVVQFKSVFRPVSAWKDYETACYSLPHAKQVAMSLSAVNDNVRVIKRVTTETEEGQI